MAVLAALLSSVAALPHIGLLERQEDVAKSYDYIIVGAGTAGLTIADRLTADGKSTVLVIEYCHLISNESVIASGGRNFRDPGIRYNITSVPQPGMNGRRQEVTIGCAVGGSSAVNAMVAVRGTKDEYDGWAELGGPNSTWNWAGILPYFKRGMHLTPPREDLAKAFNITWDPDAWGMNEDTQVYASYAENYESNLIPIYNAMKKMPGVDLPLDGAGGHNGLFWNPTSMDPERYWRSYSRTGHYDGKIDRPNYEVITRHKVQKVLFDGKVATGVQYVARDGDKTPQTVLAKKEVILSSGTIHTPQILQLSGVGPKGLLESAGINVVVDIPGVGQNFQDHTTLRGLSWRWSNGAPPAPKLGIEGDTRTANWANVGAWLGLPTISDDWEAIADRLEAQDAADFLPEGTHPTVVEGYRDFLKLHVKLFRTKNNNVLWMPLNGGGGGVLDFRVVSQGTVNINPDDPESEPVVDYRAFSNPIDLDVHVELVKFWRKFMASPDFAEYKPVEVSPGAGVDGAALGEWIRNSVMWTNYHPVATAAKKPLEKGGVVGETLLVHGVEKLSVADASIMTVSPGANLQQTVYMLAEKAADLIKARHQA